MENTQSVINPNVTNLATDCNYLEEEFWLTPQIVVWYCDGDKKKAHCADKYYSRWAWDGNRDRTPPVKVTWTHPAFWRSWNRALAFRRGKEVEIYSHSRFLTITRQPYMDETGNIIGNVPFADIQLN